MVRDGLSRVSREDASSSSLLDDDIGEGWDADGSARGEGPEAAVEAEEAEEAVGSATNTSTH
jgi:hypothetical protein